MSIWKHFKDQPFVVFVALAALPHSMWTIGTYMSGEFPRFMAWSDLPAVLWWLIPALSLAIAFDVGMVVTAGEIRSGNKSQWLVFTFYALSFASYVLQFLYVLPHAPNVPVGTGAQPIVTGIGVFIQQVCIFLLPAFLPAATILYTMASHETANVRSDAKLATVERSNLNELTVEAVPTPEIENTGQNQAFLPHMWNGNGKHVETN